MKVFRKTLAFLPILFCCCVFAQPSQTQIDQFIREVYADQADVLVFKNTSNRYTLLRDFVARVSIVARPDLAAKKFRLLSDVALLDKYNPALVRDLVFDPKNFNPIKYKLPLFSRNNEIFQVDGTDWLIIIQAVQ